MTIPSPESLVPRLETVWMELVLRHPLETHAVDLFGRIERHRVKEDDLLGRFVADPVSAEHDHVRTGGPRCVIAEGDVGAYRLPVHGVVDADHAGKPDRRVFEQCCFDLERADVGTAVDDDLLLSPEKPQIPVLVSVSQVAESSHSPEMTCLVASSAFQQPIIRLRERIKIRPTDPEPTGLPSSSGNVMSNPLTGGSIEPCLLTPDGGFNVAKPTSVIP